jgi:DHA1 family multidrug resistance protein-like MFS transporter
MGLFRDLVRDAPFGQALRLLSGNRLLQYPEEVPGFKCPTCYKDSDVPSPLTETTTSTEENVRSYAVDTADLEKSLDKQESIAAEISRPSDVEIPDEEPQLVRVESTSSESSSTSASSEEIPPTERRQSLVRIDTRSALQKSATRAELEQQFADAFKAINQPPERIQPDKLNCGTIVVDWYSTDDPGNPQNWPMKKKVIVSTII